MRYRTAGDYWEEDNGKVCFRIASMSNPFTEGLLAIHEIVEWMLIKRAGIRIEDIDKFDKKFEDNRMPGNVDEPGDELSAPYHKQHVWATIIERQVAALMNINWKEYDEAVQEVS